MTTKICSKCKLEKPTNYFSPSNFYKDGFRGQCKSCRAAYTKQYVATSGYRSRPETIKKIKVYREKYKTNSTYLFKMRSLALKKYGITESQFTAMLERQNFSCAICCRPNGDGKYQRLVVDHCHSTGKVRGLLCYGCNTSIGKLGDTAESISKVLIYLASPGGWSGPDGC